MFRKEFTDDRSIEKIIWGYGDLGKFDEVSQSGSGAIVIRHRLGRKSSKFFEVYLRSAGRGRRNIIGEDGVFEVTLL